MFTNKKYGYNFVGFSSMNSYNIIADYFRSSEPLTL